MMRQDDIHPVEVFAGTTWEAGLLKSMLEDSGIAVYLIDEIRGTLAPWHVAPGGVGAVKVTVSSEDEREARKITDAFLENMQNEE
jgi:hypothetical protein